MVDLDRSSFPIDQWARRFRLSEMVGLLVADGPTELFPGFAFHDNGVLRFWWRTVQWIHPVRTDKYNTINYQRMFASRHTRPILTRLVRYRLFMSNAENLGLA